MGAKGGIFCRAFQQIDSCISKFTVFLVIKNHIYLVTKINLLMLSTYIVEYVSTVKDFSMSLPVS